MGKAKVTIQIDEDLKNEAEAIFSQSNDTFSSAIETILRQGLADKTIALHLARGREAVRTAFQVVQEQAKVDGTAEMSMYTIDAEIAATRRETATDTKPEHKTLRQRVEAFYGQAFEIVLREHPYDYEEFWK